MEYLAFSAWFCAGLGSQFQWFALFTHKLLPFQVQSKKKQPVQEEEEEEEEEEDTSSIASSESVDENKGKETRNSSASDEELSDQELEQEPLSKSFLSNRQEQRKGANRIKKWAFVFRS